MSADNSSTEELGTSGIGPPTPLREQRRRRDSNPRGRCVNTVGPAGLRARCNQPLCHSSALSLSTGEGDGPWPAPNTKSASGPAPRPFQERGVRAVLLIVVLPAAAACRG